jgi:hypothetical protein
MSIEKKNVTDLQWFGHAKRGMEWSVECSGWWIVEVPGKY